MKLVTFSRTFPAAAAEPFATMPGVAFRVLSVSVLLVASADVDNRLVSVTARVGGVTLWRGWAAAYVTAGQTAEFSGCATPSAFTDPTGVNRPMTIPDVWLPPQSQIVVGVTDGHAGDSLTVTILTEQKE